MKKHILLITTLITLILLAGCNTENDGLFMRISKSETKKDVGTITLIAKSGTKIYAQTKLSQLQVYDTSTRNWTNLASDKRASFVATNGTTIYFAPSVTEGNNNPISKYTIDGNVTPDISSSHEIIAMSPTADLMVVKDGPKFDVYKASDQTLPASLLLDDLDFGGTYTPQLIAQNDTNFIVSGKDTATTYKHILYDGVQHLLTGINSPVLAFYNDGANIVLLTKSGESWYYGGGGGYVFTKVGTISSTLSNTPHPVFFHGTKLYLQAQEKDQNLYSIELATGAVTKETAIELPAVKAWSYLVDSTAPSIIYMGTTQNGIYKIDMATGKVTSL